MIHTNALSPCWDISSSIALIVVCQQEKSSSNRFCSKLEVPTYQLSLLRIEHRKKDALFRALKSRYKTLTESAKSELTKDSKSGKLENLKPSKGDGIKT